jgi:hypothetical protein
MKLRFWLFLATISLVGPASAAPGCYDIFTSDNLLLIEAVNHFADHVESHSKSVGGSIDRDFIVQLGRDYKFKKDSKADLIHKYFLILAAGRGNANAEGKARLDILSTIMGIVRLKPEAKVLSAVLDTIFTKIVTRENFRRDISSFRDLFQELPDRSLKLSSLYEILIFSKDKLVQTTDAQDLARVIDYSSDMTFLIPQGQRANGKSIFAKNLFENSLQYVALSIPMKYFDKGQSNLMENPLMVDVYKMLKKWQDSPRNGMFLAEINLLDSKGVYYSVLARYDFINKLAQQPSHTINDFRLMRDERFADRDYRYFEIDNRDPNFTDLGTEADMKILSNLIR